MAEYINREAAINALAKIINESDMPEDWSEGISDAMSALFRIPAADVVPVVRCKDCTHSREGKASLECEKHTYAWDKRLRWVDDNDFCCWGVRKDGDGE